MAKVMILPYSYIKNDLRIETRYGNVDGLYAIWEKV